MKEPSQYTYRLYHMLNTVYEGDGDDSDDDEWAYKPLWKNLFLKKWSKKSHQEQLMMLKLTLKILKL